MKKSKFKGGANKLTNSLKKTKKKISSNKKKNSKQRKRYNIIFKRKGQQEANKRHNVGRFKVTYLNYSESIKVFITEAEANENINDIIKEANTIKKLKDENGRYIYLDHIIKFNKNIKIKDLIKIHSGNLIRLDTKMYNIDTPGEKTILEIEELD